MEKTIDKNDIIRKLEARMETLRRLGAAIPQPPDPRPVESDAALKRKIARLRSGAIRPADPAVDSDTLAAMMERELEYRDRGRELVRELADVAAMLSDDLDAVRADLLQQVLTAFHAARHLPEAQDPNSEVSELIRRIERARRAEFGRKRRRS